MSEADKKDERARKPNTGRRNFLKIGLAGARAAAAGGVTIIRRMQGIPHDEFPVPIREDYEHIDQRNEINTFAASKALNDNHPERNRAFSEHLKKENPQSYKPCHFYETRSRFMKLPNYRDAPGYTQLEKALIPILFFIKGTTGRGVSMETYDVVKQKKNFKVVTNRTDAAITPYGVWAYRNPTHAQYR